MNIRDTKYLHPAIACAVFALCAPGAKADQGLAPLLSALESSTPLLNLRLRSETVGQDGYADDAEAVTLRSRLGFETGQAWDTSLLAEANLMWALDQRYNSSINHETRYPTVADPEDASLDRLQLRNRSLPDTSVTVGRQRINLDDQRFIGSVDFRQNEQTFDSARIVNKSIPAVTVDLTYLDRVNRIYGTRSPVGRYTGDSYLANVGYDTPLGKLTAFGYFLAFDQDHPDSTRTVGVRFAGAKALDGWTLNYLGSYADQKPYAQNTLRFDNAYYTGEVTVTVAGLTAGGGVEVLEGNGVKGFTTPLATVHMFDGWADEFLTTPPNGLQDRYGTAGYAIKNVGFLDVLSATAVYRDFESDRLDIHYGTETDLQLLGTWHKVTGILAWADYARDQFGANTRKLWVEVDYALNKG